LEDAVRELKEPDPETERSHLEKAMDDFFLTNLPENIMNMSTAETEYAKFDKGQRPSTKKHSVTRSIAVMPYHQEKSKMSQFKQEAPDQVKEKSPPKAKGKTIAYIDEAGLIDPNAIPLVRNGSPAKRMTVPGRRPSIDRNRRMSAIHQHGADFTELYKKPGATKFKKLSEGRHTSVEPTEAIPQDSENLNFN